MKLIDREKCTGCAACANSCATGAIVMAPDKEGFLFPEIDTHRCIECGNCIASCPHFTRKDRDRHPICYAAKARSNEIVKSSSSGGVFTLLCEYVIAQKGIVFGAAYNHQLCVSHIAVDNLGDIHRLRGSKYVQSDLGHAYCEVKQALSVNRLVLFSGTPCQIAGLRAYLKVSYSNLVTMEVICHGVPPAKLFDRLKNELEVAHGKLEAISFRDKSLGWRHRVIAGWYSGRMKVIEEGSLADYFRAFLAGLSLRKSCEKCQFKSGRSGADITLGDFWGIENVAPELDDDDGVSAVILHTSKGQKIFESIDCHRKSVRLSDITIANPSYSEKRAYSKSRDVFMSQVYEKGISGAFSGCHVPCQRSLIGRLKIKILKLISGYGR